MKFKFKKLSIPDVVLIEPEVFKDGRGFFFEAYKLSQFKQAGIDKRFVQVNHSSSQRGVLRGLHYQLAPFTQGKLVRAVAGEIFDVAVDIRKRSPYYGKWVGNMLSSESKQMLYVPEGFAHGFCVISKTAEIIYYCTNEYVPKYERGVIWNDSQLQIEWPVTQPILSIKDSQHPALEKAENNIFYKQ